MSKVVTIGEILEKVEDLELRAAVYDELIAYLSKFISTDSYQPTAGIKAPVGLEDAVSEETIEEVRGDLQKTVDGIRAEILKLKGQKPPTRTKKAPRKAPPKRRTKSVKKKATKKAG